MRFEDFLLESYISSTLHQLNEDQHTAEHHETMAEKLKKEAEKHGRDHKQFHSNMAAHHWHAGTAAHKRGDANKARHHFMQSYGHSN